LDTFKTTKGVNFINIVSLKYSEFQFLNAFKLSVREYRCSGHCLSFYLLFKTHNCCLYLTGSTLRLS
jgi:hypothetical protein